MGEIRYCSFHFRPLPVSHIARMTWGPDWVILLPHWTAGEISSRDFMRETGDACTNSLEPHSSLFSDPNQRRAIHSKQLMLLRVHWCIYSLQRPSRCSYRSTHFNRAQPHGRRAPLSRSRHFVSSKRYVRMVSLFENGREVFTYTYT